MNIKETLQQALTQRQDEIDLYQINIDNFSKSIKIIDDKYGENHFLHEEMQQYKASLQKMLSENILNREKIVILKTAIEQRLKELD